MNNDRSFAYFSSLPRLFPLPQSGPALHGLLRFGFSWLRSDFCFAGLGRILGNYVLDILFARESGGFGIGYTGVFFGLHFYLLVGIRIGRQLYQLRDRF